MIGQTTRYGISTIVPLRYEDAVAATKDALSTEGFGVLTEIDVAATLKKKLDVDFRPYVILGACNPPLAHRALTAERDVGLLLPCNVVVYADDDPSRSVVAALDPVEALKLTGNNEIAPIADEVRRRLWRVLAALENTSRDSRDGTLAAAAGSAIADR
jgi:uncharacterized protein (DUF302 family)